MTGTATAPAPVERRMIDFPKLWRTVLIASAVFVVAGLLALVFRGLNLGIDFEGGTSFEVATELPVGDVESLLPADVAAEARLQEVTDDAGNRAVRIRSSVEEPARVEEIRALLSEAGEITGLESVGPTWGDEITDKAVEALFFFMLAIALYLSVRLEWKMAIGALVAVAHDIIISVGVYAIFGFEVTPATVIAFLTILGYSLYDTVIVYDKVREITARVGATGRYTYTEMMNLALNQVLSRSINTTITSVLPVFSMLVVGSFILGATTLSEFSIALLIGLIVGGYSSLFVAAPTVAWLKEREPEYQQIAKKVAKKAAAVDGTRVVAADDATFGQHVGRMRTRKTTAAAKAAAAAGGQRADGDSDDAGVSDEADDSGDSSAAPDSATDHPDSVDSADDADGAEGKRRPSTRRATPSGVIPPRPRKTKKKKR